MTRTHALKKPGNDEVAKVLKKMEFFRMVPALADGDLGLPKYPHAVPLRMAGTGPLRSAAGGGRSTGCAPAAVARVHTWQERLLGSPCAARAAAGRSRCRQDGRHGGTMLPAPSPSGWSGSPEQCPRQATPPSRPRNPMQTLRADVSRGCHSLSPELLQGSHTGCSARIPAGSGDAGRALCPAALPRALGCSGHAQGHLSGTARSCVREPAGICLPLAQLSLRSKNFHSSQHPNPSLIRGCRGALLYPPASQAACPGGREQHELPASSLRIFLLTYFPAPAFIFLCLSAAF